MNQESKLKLQAYLDDELSGRELRKVTAWLEDDADARALRAELQGIKNVLRANEPELALPESREFYWSKVERAIRQAPREPAVSGFLTGYPQWFRIFATAVATALLLVAAVSVLRLATAPSTLTYMHEIETPLEDMSAISFHSQSAGMTVVWVQTAEN